MTTLAVLGPVGWWWDIIYVQLFDRNTALMWLFGWELFIGPLWAAFMIVVYALGALGVIGASAARRGAQRG